MPLEDYLMPDEDIRFQSEFDIKYGGKFYMVVLTDLRLILYARTSWPFRRDDVVTEKLKDIQGIKYREKGVIFKSAQIEVQSKSKIVLNGRRDEIKTLYQRLLPFFSLPSGPSPVFLAQATTPASPEYSAQPQQPISHPYRYCPECGIELPPNSRFCHNCGKALR